MAYSRGRCLLSDWLVKMDWSQAEYARKAKRSKRVISHFCNDERVMLPEDIYTASRLFNCRMEDIYEFIEEQDAE